MGRREDVMNSRDGRFTAPRPGPSAARGAPGADNFRNRGSSI